jgi:hypothetical protein
MPTKLTRFALSALATLMLAAAPAPAQDLFSEEEPMKPPLTDEQKAAGERESVF